MFEDLQGMKGVNRFTGNLPCEVSLVRLKVGEPASYRKT